MGSKCDTIAENNATACISEMLPETPVRCRRAQKKALIRYHPDRHHSATMQAQVEAEEIFKIVSEAPLPKPVPRVQFGAPRPAGFGGYWPTGFGVPRR